VSLMAATLRADYNCAHFFCDAWEQETGEDIRDIFDSFLAPRRQRWADSAQRRYMHRLAAPTALCAVLWRRRGYAPHLGLYVRRNVLHLTDHGVLRQPLLLASVGYHSTRYYAPRPHHS
jgi:hypothetical protein